MAHLTYNERREWDAWRDAWRGVRTLPREGRPTNAAKLMSEWRREQPSAYAAIKAGRHTQIVARPWKGPLGPWKGLTRTDRRQMTLPHVTRQRGKAMSKHAKFPRKPRKPPKRPDADGCVATVSGGSEHSHFAPDNPYNVCITRTQWKALFPKAPMGYVPEELGRGVFATAFPRTRDTITKITNDASDALAFKTASEAHVPGIPKLHAMYRLASKTSSYGPVYAIVAERLRGTLDALRPGLSSSLRCVRGKHMDGYDKSEMGECCELGNYLPRNAAPTLKKLCRKLIDQVPVTLQALDDLNIRSAKDLHVQNIGLTKGNDWSILDLGLSGLQATSKVAPSLQGAAQRRKYR